MTPPTFDDAFLAKLRELFTWRRDVRHFRPGPLPAGALDALVEDATHSPSVGYSQPWRFVVVDAPERRGAVIASFERANAAALATYHDERAANYARLKLAGLRDAPVHLAVFSDTVTATGKGLGRATMPQTLAYSATMAIYTLWLAARAQGIGVGWVSILEPHEVVRALEVPPSWEFIAYLCIGYPRDEHDTPELERAGWEARDPAAAQIYRR